MDYKGNASLLKSTKVTEVNFNHGGCIPVVFGVLILLGCISAYVIAVARGNVDPILPLISDAAGSPPQNGIFGTLICFGGMFGVVFMIQRYMIVVERNRQKNKLITAVNRLGLCVGIMSMLGITLITGYPINFYRNRDNWLKDVGLPHIVGSVMFSALGLIYIGLQCILTLLVKRTKNEYLQLPARVILLFLCTAAYVYHLITVPEHIGGISHLYYINSTEIAGNDTSLLPYPPTLGADLRLPIDTSGSYFIAAVTEWAFVFFFCCFFFTFYSELQQYSLQFVVETHTAKESAEEEAAKIDISKPSLAHLDLRRASLAQLDIRKASLKQKNGSAGVVETKPAPEVRKFVRRDSTCQTIDDEAKAKIIYPSTKKEKKTSETNGTKKILLDADVDAKLNRILKEVETSESKVENGTQHTQVEKSDSEAERIAIEKIDTVVKNAENDAGVGTEEVIKRPDEGDE